MSLLRRLDDLQRRRPVPGFGWAVIQKYLEDPLSEKILLSEFSPGDGIEVGVAEDGESLSFKVPSSSAT